MSSKFASLENYCAGCATDQPRRMPQNDADSQQLEHGTARIVITTASVLLSQLFDKRLVRLGLQNQLDFLQLWKLVETAPGKQNTLL